MRHMNRVLVGTMLQVGGGRRTVASFVELLAGRPRGRGGSDRAGVRAVPGRRGVRRPARALLRGVNSGRPRLLRAWTPTQTGKNVPLDEPKTPKPRKFPLSGKNLGLDEAGAPRGTKFPVSGRSRPPRRARSRTVSSAGPASATAPSGDAPPAVLSSASSMVSISSGTRPWLRWLGNRRHCSPAATERSSATSRPPIAWSMLTDYDGDVHVTVVGRKRRSRTGLRVHRAAVAPPTRWRHGLLVTSPAQTLLDLAATQSPHLEHAFIEAHGLRLVRAAELARAVDRAGPTPRRPRPQRTDRRQRVRLHPIQGRTHPPRAPPRRPPPRAPHQRHRVRLQRRLRLAGAPPRRRVRRLRLPRPPEGVRDRPPAGRRR